MPFLSVQISFASGTVVLVETGVVTTSWEPLTSIHYCNSFAPLAQFAGSTLLLVVIVAHLPMGKAIDLLA
jgi:hypothetical protein